MPVRNVVPVSGILSYQGRPLEHYVISFVPITEGAGSAIGTTDASGRFTLSTNKPNDGAAPGNYRVGVVYAGPPNTNDTPGAESQIEDPKLLPKSPTPIPTKFNNPEKSEVTQEVPAGGLTDLKLDLK